MLQQFFADWTQVVASYFGAAFAVLAGGIHPVSLLPAVGIVCLAVGVALAIYWKEPRALRLVPLVLVASLTPFVLGFADRILSWVGIAFSILFGVVAMLVWIGVVATETRRVAVWLIGAFALTLAVYSGLGIAAANLSL